MSRHAEAMLAANRVSQPLQLVALELDERVANRAVQMVVLRIPIVVLVDRPPAQIHPSQQARLDQFVQRAINRRPTDLLSQVEPRQIGDQLIGVKVVVPLENKIDERPPLRASGA